MRWLIEPGLFASHEVRLALAAGVVVALVSSAVGVLVVMRGQSFAGHALTDVSAAGGSGATVVGVSPLAGFVGLSVVAAVAMDLIGLRRVKGRDVATGVVLGAALGLTALFLHFDTTLSASTGVTQQVLFGSIFTVSAATVAAAASAGAAVLVGLALLYRPLVLSSLDEDLARTKGVASRLVGAGFLVAMAVAVGLASLAVGSILATALLVGPAATATRRSSSLLRAFLWAAALSVGSTATGVVLSYDSAAWLPGSEGLPVSFFIVAIIFVSYLASGVGRVESR